MGTVAELSQLGFTPNQAKHLGTDGVISPLNRTVISAAGSNQGDATLSSGNFVRVNGADGTKGIILSTPVIGLVRYIQNLSASNLLVYPNVGSSFNGLATNAPITVSAWSLRIITDSDYNNFITT
jgi:hypothetical protein